MLLKSQMNEVLLLVKRVGLNPSNFDWGKSGNLVGASRLVSVLRHKPGNWRFRFELNGEAHVAIFSPGATTPEERRNTGSWDLQLDAVLDWLTFLKREIDAPDLWALLSQDAAIAATLSRTSDDNTVFSSAEQKKIAQTLRELRDYSVANYNLTETQTEELINRLEYLKSASERLGRKDWMVAIMGTVMSWIVTAAIPPEVAHGFFTTAVHMFAWVVANLPQLKP